MLDEFLSNIQEISAGVKDVLRRGRGGVGAHGFHRGRPSRIRRSPSPARPRGIGEVSKIAGKVKEDSARWPGMISAILKETDEVQRLGDENLKMMEGLKAKIDSVTLH